MVDYKQFMCGENSKKNNALCFRAVHSICESVVESLLEPNTYSN